MKDEGSVKFVTYSESLSHCLVVCLPRVLKCPAAGRFVHDSMLFCGYKWNSGNKQSMF